MNKSENIAKLHGSIKLLFQPAEEKYGGALGMIKAGCLEEGSLGPRVDQVYGIHIWSCKYSVVYIIYVIWCIV